MTIRIQAASERHLRMGAVLAALDLRRRPRVGVFRDTPDRVARRRSSIIAFVAGACGVILNWRLGRAHSHRAPRSADGPAEPRAARGPDRAGPPARAPHRASRSRSSRSTSTGSRTSTTFAATAPATPSCGRSRGASRRSFAPATPSPASAATSSWCCRSERGTTSRPLRSSAACGTRFGGRSASAARAIEIDGSIGWAVFPDDGATSDELLARADGQMYATKRDTRRRRRCCSGAASTPASSATSRRRSSGTSSSSSTSRSSTSPRASHTPPRLSSAGSSPTGRSSPRRSSSPTSSAPRSSGSSPSSSSPRRCARRRSGARRGHDLGVSVNIPYRLLDDPQFVEGLARLLRSSERPAGSITLEVVPAGPGAGARARRGGARATRRSSASASRSTTGDAPRLSPPSASSRSTS